MPGLFVQQAFGQFIGHPRGGAFFGLGVGKDFGQAAADVRQVCGDARQVGAGVFEGDVDQPARVDHVVWRVEDAAAFQLVGDVQVGQLCAGGYAINLGGEAKSLKVRGRITTAFFLMKNVICCLAMWK